MDDILVKTNEPVKNKNPIVILNSFYDLVKVEVELSTPIIYVVDNNKYNFYIYGQNLTYSYSYSLSNINTKNTKEN